MTCDGCEVTAMVEEILDLLRLARLTESWSMVRAVETRLSQTATTADLHEEA